MMDRKSRLLITNIYPVVGTDSNQTVKVGSHVFAGQALALSSQQRLLEMVWVVLKWRKPCPPGNGVEKEIWNIVSETWLLNYIY